MDPVKLMRELGISDLKISTITDTCVNLTTFKDGTYRVTGTSLEDAIEQLRAVLPK